MKLIKFILWLHIVIAPGYIYAGNHLERLGNSVLARQFINDNGWNFIENKGQLVSSEIKYYGHQGAIYLYCRPGKISFVFTKIENKQIISEATGLGIESGHALSPSAININRIDLIILNSNPSAQIIATDQQEYYENYYTTRDADHGITNVHTYKSLTYKSIYPDIDLVLKCKERGMEYSFIVYPGGNVSYIQLQWDGAEATKAHGNGGFKYINTLGSLEESVPISFSGGKVVQSSFIKNGFNYGFKVGGYDKSKILFIDPDLLWGTYYGGSGMDIGYGVTTDSTRNVYIVGNTTSKTGIATKGAYQTSLIGISQIGDGDAFLAKFNNNGRIQWATYYGGDSGTTAWAVVTDRFANIYITGITTSSSGIATNGGYQTSYAGSGDAFLAKFNTLGALQWSTYYGGPGVDYGNGVSIDIHGNAYISGRTNSSSGIATNGAFQTFFSGFGQMADEDAFLAKFNNNGTMQWATYFGGDSSTIAWAVATDKFANVYITGITNSSFGIATSGAYKTSYDGNGDAFIAKFDALGFIQWATYFGGDNVDEARGVSIDSSGNVYFTGVTESITGVATIGVYQTSLGGGEDAFLAKFSNNGVIQWATYYGDNGNSGSSCIAIDNLGGIYISGGTTSNTGMATSGAYKTYFDGTDNIFLAKFTVGGERVWASYYGGGGVSYVESICADNSGNVNITGYTKSNSGIATGGAYLTSYAGGGDAFLVRFNLKVNHDAGIAYLPGPPPVVCKGMWSVQVQLDNLGLDTLNSANINWSVDGNLQPPYHWSGNLAPDSSMPVTVGSYNFTSGIYTIKSWTSKPNGVLDSLPGNDTFVTTINVNASPPIANIGQNSYSICTGTHIKIGANAQPNYIYLWSSDPAGFGSTLANPVVNPAANTVYDLTVTDTLTGCTNTNSANVTVSILHAPVANAGSNQSLCIGISVQIGSNALSGDTYSWTSNPVGFTSTIANPTVNPSQTISYLLSVKNPNGCTNFDSVIITVNPRPHPVVGQPQNICSQTAIQLGSAPSSGHVYQWTSKPLGFSSAISNPIDSPNLSRTYYLKETISATGCADSDSVRVTVVPRPNAKFTVKNIGGFEYQFTVSNPNYPFWQYHWALGDFSSGKSDTMSGYNVLHVYPKNGNYHVSLTVSLPGYCTEIDSELLIVNQSFSLNIFPNPFGLQTNIQYLLTSPGHVKITMTDEVGRNIGTLVDKQLIQGEYDTYFSGAAWKTRPGMYFVVFQLDDKVIVKKIIQIDSIYY